jgi:hypothetical protein
MSIDSAVVAVSAASAAIHVREPGRVDTACTIAPAVLGSRHAYRHDVLGEVDQLDGESIQTKFFVLGVPLLPLSSHYVVKQHYRGISGFDMVARGEATPPTDGPYR